MSSAIKDVLLSVFVCSIFGHDEMNNTPYLGYEFGHGFNHIECKRCKAERWA